MAINLNSLLTDEERLLLARVDEMYSRADSGVPGFLGFLNMRERFIIENQRHAIFTGNDSEPLSFFWGGFDDAERTMLFILPSYMRYSITEGVQNNVVFRDEFASAIVPLKIKTSGYVKLAHRDFLGSLIGLGIDRFAMGDILLGNDGAIVFVNPKVAELIKNELTYIGRDKVKAEYITLPDDFTFSRQFEKVSGTVASARLDAVVSELARTSREKAKGLIQDGLVEHNYFTAVHPDCEVTNGDVISIRKTGAAKGGKFIVDSVDTLSQKGRIRLLARRYI